MSLESLPDWLLPLWLDMVGRRERLPHALLFCGPAGSGKRLLAEHLAHALLCQTPGPEGFACGKCPDCTWMAAGNHPDYFRVLSAADEAAEEDEGDVGETGKKEKSKSTQIVIDQIRELQRALEIGTGGHAGGRRLVIIDPAEAMNQAAANALLKSLEEPGGRTVYLLVSHTPRRLLPTIRSRCQVLDFPRPTRSAAEAWLGAQGVGNLALLGFASGLPMAARSYAKGPLAEAREQLAKDLGSMGTKEPLKLAAEWESRLKAKGALESGLNAAVLLDWLERWTSDGVRVAQGESARFFSDHQVALNRLAPGRAAEWMGAYREILEQRPIALHPLNPRLFLEDVFMRLFRRVAIR